MTIQTFDIEHMPEEEKSPYFEPTMIVVQARMLSTRLPGKVLKEVGGRPLLFYLIERLRRVHSIEGIVIATSKNRADDAIVQFCDLEGLHYIRGSEEDVLARYYAAVCAFGLEVCIRITGDCPLMDPVLIEKALSCFRAQKGAIEYLSNTIERTFPRGMCVEIFSVDALKKAFFEAVEPAAREHVTPYIVRHPEQFRLAHFVQERDDSSFRLTVDTQEDFELIRRILEELYPKKPEFTLQDIKDLLAVHPEWKEINAHIMQKTV